MFRPLLVAIFRWLVIQKIQSQLLYMSTDPLLHTYKGKCRVFLTSALVGNSFNSRVIVFIACYVIWNIMRVDNTVFPASQLKI
jgi:hypothetical protein